MSSSPSTPISPGNLIASLVGLGLLGYYLYIRRSKGSHLPLPPGPQKLPFIGNLLNWPKDFQWVQFQQWGKEFNSGIIHLDLAGASIVVVNTLEIANDLFEKRSAIYSSRPRFVMLNELMGWVWSFAFAQYGEHWRRHRKLFQQEFHPTAVMRHQPHELKATRAMLPHLLRTPEKFMEHLRYMTGSIIMSAAYGINVSSSEEPYIETAEKAMIGLSAASVPGAFLVDSIPLLKYVPSWVPGAGFQTKARDWRKEGDKMIKVPFAVVQRDIANGIAKPSFTSYCLENMDKTKDIPSQERIIQETAANFYLAGSDTTVSALSTFILAMACFPEVQAKAQQELDNMLAPGHLPDFNDEDLLPYISAIVKEVLRWQPVTPIAISHYLSLEDEYGGYRLPADSIVVGNAWAMLHNDVLYPDPFSFKPERFLKDGKLNPEIKDPTVAFGFGRRICPGRHMAISSLWIAAASILTTFNITKAVNENGSTIEPTQAYITGLVCHPLPFPCSIKPRSKEAEALILSDATFD